MSGRIVSGDRETALALRWIACYLGLQRAERSMAGLGHQLRMGPVWYDEQH